LPGCPTCDQPYYDPPENVHTPPLLERMMRHLPALSCRLCLLSLFSARDSRESPARYVYSPVWFACLYSMAHAFGQNCSAQFMRGELPFGADGNDRGFGPKAGRVGRR
jgi:hypothetical protein